jgi:TetR/AcrR family transcriptional regulator, cholesterol catabolism regulator
MTFNEFKNHVSISTEEICVKILEQNRKNIKVKKEKRVIDNLIKIFNAALSISNKKGFQAMSMRDLSKESGLSMGALYSYFTSKEELLDLMQNQGRQIAFKVLDDETKQSANSREKLHRAIKAHLYLSEVMQPWFYFSFIEAKNLNKTEQKKAIESELFTEEIFNNILISGQKEGLFRAGNTVLTASVIKAMLQDWYLKRWKYRKRKISIDEYADFIIRMIEFYIRTDSAAI